MVLYSDVVDAMSQHDDGVRFYIGHELGHLRMKHLSGHLLRWPVLWLPLLGAAYSRARESTCDRHGLACSSTPEGAARALAALSAGAQRWKQLDITAYRRQADESTGFWMSFHELTAGYPWLTKRAARVLDVNAPGPGRNAMAYVLAALVPYAGRLGAGFGMLILVYVVGVLAAVALPAYQDYTVRAKVSMAVAGSQGARSALEAYYQAHDQVPESLEAAGIPAQLADGTRLEINQKNMALTLSLPQGEIVFTPQADDQGRVTWECTHGGGLKASQVPPNCRNDGL